MCVFITTNLCVAFFLGLRPSFKFCLEITQLNNTREINEKNENCLINSEGEPEISLDRYLCFHHFTLLLFFGYFILQVLIL